MMETSRRMNRLGHGGWFPIVLALLGVLLLSAFAPAYGMIPIKAGGKAIGKASGKAVSSPPVMKPGESVDAYMAGLTDTEARQVLAERLREDAASRAAHALPASEPAAVLRFEVMFKAAATAVEGMYARLVSVFSAVADDETRPLARTVETLTGGKGPATS